MEPVDAHTSDAERTLRRVVVGYRAVAAAWLVILGVISVAGPEGPARPGVVVATMVLAVAWALVTIALHAQSPDLMRSWLFLAIDTGVAAWTLVAPDVAGSENFYGGYPMSPVFLAAYGRGMVGGLTTAVALGTVQLSRLAGPADPTASSAAVLIYVFAGAVAGWAVGLLREADRTTRMAEAALAREQVERVRAEEKAEMAAHLHDSVLQTLALIRRNSADESEVASLARRQERELRAWLYGTGGGSTRGAFGELMRRMCAEVEDAHQVAVHLVTVGDAEGDASMEALVQAAREAIVNAAKHSGAANVAVYAESSPERVTVFVRDRGRGFDYGSVPADRQGIRESIINRLVRSGGRATVHTKVGEGTEVELVLER
ncbi:MAG: histidine kinase [Acidimicrobiia bacterium]|nr:histidine kinase [Acidimicrobiia bacterium]MDH3397967.1 histidine kinase [Acidimicrobiia bacterium]